MSELSDTIKRMAMGALKGGLITGGVGAGIPATYHATQGTLDESLAK